jgi:hypothetical protein
VQIASYAPIRNARPGSWTNHGYVSRRQSRGISTARMTVAALTTSPVRHDCKLSKIGTGRRSDTQRGTFENEHKTCACFGFARGVVRTRRPARIKPTSAHTCPPELWPTEGPRGGLARSRGS